LLEQSVHVFASRWMLGKDQMAARKSCQQSNGLLGFGELRREMPQVLGLSLLLKDAGNDAYLALVPCSPQFERGVRLRETLQCRASVLEVRVAFAYDALRRRRHVV